MDKTRKILYPLTSDLDDIMKKLSETQESLHDAMTCCEQCEYGLSHEWDENAQKEKTVAVPADASRTIAFCRQVIKDGLATTKDLINAVMSATTMIDGIQPQAK